MQEARRLFVTHPQVTSCFDLIHSNLLTNGLSARQGKCERVTPEYQAEVLDSFWTDFVRDALRETMILGFYVFVVRPRPVRWGKIIVPEIVEPHNYRVVITTDKYGCRKYSVESNNGYIAKRAVFMAHYPPDSEGNLSSPLSALVCLHRQITEFRENALAADALASNPPAFYEHTEGTFTDSIGKMIETHGRFYDPHSRPPSQRGMMGQQPSMRAGEFMSEVDKANQLSLRALDMAARATNRASMRPERMDIGLDIPVRPPIPTPGVMIPPGYRIASGPTPARQSGLVDYLLYEDHSVCKALGVPYSIFEYRSARGSDTLKDHRLILSTARSYSRHLNEALRTASTECYLARVGRQRGLANISKCGVKPMPDDMEVISFACIVGLEEIQGLYARGHITWETTRRHEARALAMPESDFERREPLDRLAGLKMDGDEENT